MGLSVAMSHYNNNVVRQFTSRYWGQTVGVTSLYTLFVNFKWHQVSYYWKWNAGLNVSLSEPVRQCLCCVPTCAVNLRLDPPAYNLVTKSSLGMCLCVGI